MGTTGGRLTKEASAFRARPCPSKVMAFQRLMSETPSSGVVCLAFLPALHSIGTGLWPSSQFRHKVLVSTSPRRLPAPPRVWARSTDTGMAIASHQLRTSFEAATEVKAKTRHWAHMRLAPLHTLFLVTMPRLTISLRGGSGSWAWPCVLGTCRACDCRAEGLQRGHTEPKRECSTS